MAKEFRYKPQYGVIVICENEEEQKKVFEELQKEGKKLKVVTT
jgi:predicted 3-demethylubiquinone-9 3-methyltransferase (glyoxalase superfamily)